MSDCVIEGCDRSQQIGALCRVHFLSRQGGPGDPDGGAGSGAMTPESPESPVSLTDEANETIAATT